MFSGFHLSAIFLPSSQPTGNFAPWVFAKSGMSVLLVVDRDRHDLEAARLVLHVELLELREGLLAGLAPRRPEVDDRDLARARWSSCSSPFIESMVKTGALSPCLTPLPSPPPALFSEAGVFASGASAPPHPTAATATKGRDAETVES